MNNILITSIVTTLLLSGCGSSSSQTPGADINNSGKTKNDLGYYGEGVYFAGMPVVGFWDDLVAGHQYYNIFKLNENGSVELYEINASQAEYVTLVTLPEYGVNESGTLLTLKYGNVDSRYYGPSRNTIEYLNDNQNDWNTEHCINVHYIHTSTIGYGSQDYNPYIFCRSDELNVTYMEQFWWHIE
jgi:hypothetical protein